MAQRDPGAVARERAEIFGLGPPGRRPLARAYALLMALVLTILGLLLVPELAAADTYPVGPGAFTLPQALDMANGHPGADTINFVSGVTSVTVNQSLRATDAVTIDGGSGPPVTIIFSSVSGDGFTATAPNVVLNNLAITGAGGNGITASGSSGHDSFINVDVYGVGQHGALLGGAGNDTYAGANGRASAIYGDGGDGIRVDSSSNVFDGVLIGVHPDGTVDLNGGSGFSFSAIATGNQVLDSGIVSRSTDVALANSHNVVANDAFEFTQPGLAIDTPPLGQRNANSPNAPGNFPIITSATVMSSGTTVAGTLNVRPNDTGVVEVYDLFGSTRVPFAEATYRAGPDGNATWHLTTSNVLGRGHQLVAFQVNGSGSDHITSEFGDPFDPFASQGGGGGGVSIPRTCPVSPAAQPIQFHLGAGEGANPRYVAALFQAAGLRPPTQSQLNQFSGLLSSGQLTRFQVAKLVDESPASRSQQVIDFYHTFLARAPTSSELQAGLNSATAFGERHVEAGLLASDEFYNCSGGTNAAYVNQLYQDLLRRPADPAAQAFVEELANGTSRGTVVSEIMGSTEARNDFVKDLFNELLNRQPDNQTLNFYAGLLSSSTEETVMERIESSPAFLAHIGIPPAFNTPAFLPNGVIAFNLLRPANVQIVVFGAPRGGSGDLAAAAAPRLRQLGVVRFGHHRKGRVRLHWNHTVNGHRLKRGRYVVLLQATGPGGRVLYQSDPIKLMIKR